MDCSFFFFFLDALLVVFRSGVCVAIAGPQRRG